MQLLPLVSRWALTEEVSGTKDLRQVQYAFVELPKIAHNAAPQTVAERWAWLFKYGVQLEAMPAGLTEAQTETLHLAEEATLEALLLHLKTHQAWPGLN